MAADVPQLFRVFGRWFFGSAQLRVCTSCLSYFVGSDLASSGFVVNESKSCWEPVQVGEWLGFLINSIQFTFQLPESKLAKLKGSRNLQGVSPPRRFHYFAIPSSWCNCSSFHEADVLFHPV